MNGRRGVFSPDLDPITALGIEARTAEERRRFAELSVQQDFKRVEAELAFQREVDAAWKRLYPHILPIGAGMGSAPAQPRSHGRLALFVKADCPPCDKTLTKLLASQKPFDIYLVGSEGQDAKVREWASRRHIPAERVKTRAITLNHDAGRWLKLGKGQMPVVLEQGKTDGCPSRSDVPAIVSPLACAQSIPSGYRQIAEQENVPAEALYSLALTESAKKLAHGVRPWPWTINVAGIGYRYASRDEAYQALLGFIRRYPLKRIDVGVAQVNLGWNGSRFSSYWHAFDPYTNLRVAARILRECYDAQPGSWMQAAGCYHHPAGGKPARVYKAVVQRHLNTLNPVKPTAVSWVEPKRKTP